MSGAFVVFLELIFGVALGTAIIMAVLGIERLPVEKAHTLPAWVQLVPLVVMPLALTALGACTGRYLDSDYRGILRFLEAGSVPIFLNRRSAFFSER